MGYGVGIGLQKGVETAGSFLIPAMRDKMVMDRREQMFNKELAANAGILAGNQSGQARMTPTSGPGPAMGSSPAALLAGAGANIHEGSSDPSGAPQMQPSAAPGGPMQAPASALAGMPQEQAQDPNALMSEEDVYNLYKKSADERTANQIKMADEMDVARGWNRSYNHMNTIKRSLVAIQGALKDESGNAAMMLVPNAGDPAQARQVLSGEYMKLMQQYKPLEQEWRQWDLKRNELGIDANAISSEPGIAQWLNRRQQAQRGGATAKPGARSVMPAPNRGR